MQNSELFRRGIVVPLDRDAENSLRVNDVSRSTRVRYLGIANDQLFETLWKVGLFQAINAQCRSTLDDYEEGLIEPSSASGILTALELVASKPAAQQPEVARFLADARGLVNEAAMSLRPILFVL
jgi:hypothetical protein